MKHLSVGLALITAASIALGSAACASELSFNVGATSDYVARGSSQTAHKPSYSAGADLNFKSGLYLSTWTANVDFGDGTDQEIDVKAGYRAVKGQWSFDYALATYSYLDDPGLGLDMVEAVVSASRPVGPVTTTFTYAYSPDYFNIGSPSTWVELKASVPITKSVTLDGAFGYQAVNDKRLFPSYNTANVGLTYALTKSVGLSARYTISDLSAKSVGFFADDIVSVGISVGF